MSDAQHRSSVPDPDPGELPRLPPRSEPPRPAVVPYTSSTFTPAPITYDQLMRELEDPPRDTRKKKRRRG